MRASATLGAKRTTGRRRPSRSSTCRTGRVAPGHEHLGAAAMGPLGEAPERCRSGRVGERHGGQIDDHDFWKLPDALENGRDRAGGAEEEGAGDPVDHDLPVAALSARIGGAVAGGIGLVLVEKGRPALDRDELRHAVHEQEAAEHHADQDAFGEIPEHGEKEGREQHERLAARAGQDGEELVPLGHVPGNDRKDAGERGKRDVGGERRRDQHEGEQEQRMQDTRDRPDRAGTDVRCGAGDRSGGA